jgi:DNA repair exonuclease SbcCD ATPase subunit
LQWKARSESLAKEQTRLKELSFTFAAVQAQLRQREEVDSAYAIVSEQREEKGQELSSLQSQEAVMRANLQVLAERLSVLGHADEATCPVCKRPMAEEKAAELLDHYQTEQNQLKAKLIEVEQAQSRARTALDELKESAEVYNKQLANLPSPKRAEELGGEIANQEELISRLQVQVDALQEAPEKADALRAKQEGLREERRTTRDKLQVLTNQREELSHQLVGMQAQQAELPTTGRKEGLVADLTQQEGVIKRLEEQIADLGDVPDQIGTLEAALSEVGNPKVRQITLTATIAQHGSVEDALSSAQIRQSRSRRPYAAAVKWTTSAIRRTCR